jgi:CheY-like chemotaxis protein
MKILIAEDNPVLADVLRFNLARLGHDVWLVHRGTDAMARLLQELPDLLLTDYHMPGASGEELCRFVREELQCHSLPIVVCSAKGLELDNSKFQRLWNVSHIIYKPFSMREIIEIIVNTASVPDLSPVEVGN